MDIVIPITGRRKSGKDTIARFGIERFSCAGSVALSDWFKQLLAEHFKLPVASFYDESQKDSPLAKPLIIRRGDISRLLSKTSQLASKVVDVRYQRLSIGKWEGREIRSIRELMIWWADEVISNSLSEELHCVITAIALEKLPRKHKDSAHEGDVFFVTDARRFGQSKWFQDHYKHVYPIRIVRPLGTLDQDPSETATEKFPTDYFFAEILNDEDLTLSREENLERLAVKVQEVLGRIRADIKHRLPPRPNVQQPSKQFTQTRKEN